MKAENVISCHWDIITSNKTKSEVAKRKKKKVDEYFVD